ncbi:hypothetical protein [Thalassospira povalilytica]|uniref:hypothetical protein n=1 Tax=Thalassospira povalilytica TaxID=732237 RepID=UPI001D183687|nr:hypothetical protein [Thalassospira povalilytica]MCC4240417.1 hypothetical protein [Thalassospira povalilytica]
MHEIEDSKRAFASAVGEWLNIEKSFHSEAMFLLGLLDQHEDNQTFRRAFVRSSWAQIEGSCYCLKEIASAAMMLEGAPHIKLPHDKKSGAIERVKLSIKAATMVLSPNLKPDFNSVAWASLKRSIATRNALAHPKNASDLNVSSESMSDARLGFEWFIQTIRDISQTARDRSV